MAARPLNLSEAIELLRNLSDGLHQQEINTPDLTLCAVLDRAWTEATGFIIDYDAYLVAYEESEKKYRATVDAMLARYRRGE